MSSSYYHSDTIAAIATAKGKGALAIIRLSGSESFEVMEKIVSQPTRYTNILRGENYKKLYRASLHDEGQKLDEAMFCLFKAPNSYTGENMVEIYCHGNNFIVSQILECLLRHCRLAEKGEFTYRAFLNKKIDLTQAEAVGNLLNAETKNAQKAALYQLEGRLYHKIKELLDRLISLRIIFELSIDFVEDEVPEYEPGSILDKIESLLNDLKTLIETGHDGIIMQEGVKICLYGAPNVGKSSIFNAFLETERAIVTPLPGTTRDYLEEGLSFSGYKIRLYDTAGIQGTKDLIEILGIERSKKCIEEADIIFYISDPSIENDVDQRLLTALPEEKVIKVLNKADLIDFDEKKRDFLLKKDSILCSTVTKDGLNELKKAIISRFKNMDMEIKSGIITNSRQLACVNKAYKSLMKAKEAIENDNGLDFIAFDIQQASNELEEIIGKVTPDDILSRIFEDFCIGK
ncbi:MAG: tRNA uridine-5-carboxymethylaminomethyl(34) synthesis GTPase MnmE [Candidatus Cloacimonetes bacterium]|nr:tRNA uridine-5-carboxymethylaminomethyl(34) synthesis GTPase MnmE [Candidatus Cloacimonadota bacterium]